MYQNRKHVLLICFGRTDWVNRHLLPGSVAPIYCPGTRPIIAPSHPTHYNKNSTQ